jgi:hypothetical protein
MVPAVPEHRLKQQQQKRRYTQVACFSESLGLPIPASAGFYVGNHVSQRGVPGLRRTRFIGDNRAQLEKPSPTKWERAVRKFMTRILAAGALIALYAISTITMTGLTLSSSTTTADAQGGGGRGGGGGGGGRGAGGGGRGGGGRGAGRGGGRGGRGGGRGGRGRGGYYRGGRLFPGGYFWGGVWIPLAWPWCHEEWSSRRVYCVDYWDRVHHTPGQDRGGHASSERPHMSLQSTRLLLVVLVGFEQVESGVALRSARRATPAAPASRRGFS